MSCKSTHCGVCRWTTESKCTAALLVGVAVWTMRERCLMLRPHTQTSSLLAGRAGGTPCMTSCRVPPTLREERCPSPCLCPSCTSTQEEEVIRYTDLFGVYHPWDRNQNLTVWSHKILYINSTLFYLYRANLQQGKDTTVIKQSSVSKHLATVRRKKFF